MIKRFRKAAITIAAGAALLGGTALMNQAANTVPYEYVDQEPSASPTPSDTPTSGQPVAPISSVTRPPISGSKTKKQQTHKPTPSPSTSAVETSSRPASPVAVQKIRQVTLSPVTAFHSQSTIDQGKLVTWMTVPTCLLAGHDNMGWAWLDNISTGTIVKVTTGPCSGTYKVVGHKWQSVKGGPIPSWMSDYDLVLQTCTGSTGMGFSLAQRIR